MTLYPIAWCELILCWIIWAWAPIFRAPHGQKRASITIKGATALGILLEMSAYGVASFFRVGGDPGWPRLLASMVAAPMGAAVMWIAVAHLGRQFRINAGLYHDHELVRTGPYSIVRHPIYASMLLMLAATCMLLTRWEFILLAVALFLAGTEIRVHTEDGLLASRFGANFDDYRRRVSAYIPYLR